MIDETRLAELLAHVEAWNAQMSDLHHAYDLTLQLLRCHEEFPEPSGEDTPTEEVVLLNVFASVAQTASAMSRDLAAIT